MMFLRPAGSDPEVVCQKNSFLKVSVSLGGYGPSVAHGKHCVRRRCVQATKNKAETCSLLDAIGRRSCGRWRDWGIKIDVWENPVVYIYTLRLETGLVYTVRYAEPETAAQSSCSHFRVSLGTLTLSLFCMHRSGCSYCDASGEFCLPSFRVLSFSAWAKKKKKKSHCRRTTVSSSRRAFANPSKFLWTLRSTDWKWTAVDRRRGPRGITAAEGHGAGKSTGWPRQRCTKSPRLRQLDEWKETKKKNPELVPARLGAVKLHFRCCRDVLDLVVNLLDHCWARHAPLTLFDCITCAIYSRSLYATSQRHDLWQWCNGKAIEAQAGRRPTARWLCLRKLVFMRLPLLP